MILGWIRQISVKRRKTSQAGVQPLVDQRGRKERESECLRWPPIASDFHRKGEGKREGGDSYRLQLLRCREKKKKRKEDSYNA